MQFPVSLRLHRSLLYDWLTRLAAALALTGLLLSGLPGLLMLLSVCLWLALVVSAWRQRQPECLEILLYKDGRLLCLHKGRESETVMVMYGTLIHPYLTVLRVDTVSGVRHWVVMPDSLAAEDFRRLRVWLKWCALSAPRSGIVSDAEV